MSQSPSCVKAFKVSGERMERFSTSAVRTRTLDAALRRSERRCVRSSSQVSKVAARTAIGCRRRRVVRKKACRPERIPLYRNPRSRYTPHRCRCGGMVDTGDLKSPAPKGACRFESCQRHHVKSRAAKRAADFTWDVATQSLYVPARDHVARPSPAWRRSCFTWQRGRVHVAQPRTIVNGCKQCFLL